MRLNEWGYLVLPLLLLGCHSTGARPPDDVPAGWRKVDAEEGFSFYLPPGMQPVQVQAIDSKVGVYRGDGLYLLYDYGRFSDPLDYEEKAEYQEKAVRIDGKRAKVISYYDPGTVHEFKYVAAVHFPNVGPRQAKLTVFVNCRGPSETETARQIFDSIRFR